MSVLIFPLKLSATTVYFDAPKGPIAEGSEFLLSLYLDPEGKEINALEGEVSFSADTLTLISVRDGDSMVDFWLNSPSYRDGLISFAGVIPGGFKGVQTHLNDSFMPGKIFSMIVRAENRGQAAFSAENMRVLLNDGLGTPASLKIKAAEFDIVSAGEGKFVAREAAESSDVIPPETFKPLVVSESSLYDGKKTLIFSTQDKESGMYYYEVAEKKGQAANDYDDLPWRKTESPYLLQDQSLDSTIYVKAIDNAGNVRVEILPAREDLFVDKIFIIFATIIVFLIIFSTLWKKRAP